MLAYQGYLRSRITNPGTRSEGPEYFLQGPDGREVQVIKRSRPWAHDNNLYRLLGRKVLVHGDREGNGIRYTEVQLRFPSASGAGSDPPWSNQASLVVEESGEDRALPAVQTLRYGDLGPDVYRLQRRLQRLGYDIGADGYFGTPTAEILSLYQRNQGLSVTSEYDAETQNRMPL